MSKDKFKIESKTVTLEKDTNQNLLVAIYLGF
jgi:hypothetical protein